MMRKVAKIILGTAFSAVALSSLAIAGTDNQIANSLTAKLSSEQATTLALQMQPGTLQEIELESEDGKMVFDIEIVTQDGEVELLLDANTGELLAMERENDHEQESEESDDQDDV